VVVTVFYAYIRAAICQQQRFVKLQKFAAAAALCCSLTHHCLTVHTQKHVVNRRHAGYLNVTFILTSRPMLYSLWQSYSDQRFPYYHLQQHCTENCSVLITRIWHSVNPVLSAELGYAGSLLQARSQRHNLKIPVITPDSNVNWDRCIRDRIPVVLSGFVLTTHQQE
jgi:hypothetical protein